jgi:hypothetical protein
MLPRVLHLGIDNILHIPLRKVAQLFIIHVHYRFQNGDRVVQSEMILGW